METNGGNTTPTLGLGLAAGLTAWMGLAAARPGAGGLAFFAVIGAAALALGALEPRARRSRIGASLVAGPVLVAGWTTWRGDEDGLWAAIYVLLAVAGLACAGLAGLGPRLAARLGVRGARRAAGVRGRLPACAAAVAVAGAGALTVAMWPAARFDARLDRLESAARAVPAPGNFTDRGVTRSGSPLCEGCEPVVVRTLSTTVPDACTAFRAAVPRAMRARVGGDCDGVWVEDGRRVGVTYQPGFPDSTISFAVTEDDPGAD